MRIELEGPAAPTLPERALSARGWTAQADEAKRYTEFWYDTPSLALLRWGAALMRVDNDGWRLCVPAQAGAEARVVDAAGDAPNPPPAIMDVVRPLVRGWEPQRVLTMEVISRQLMLQRDDTANPVLLIHEARQVLDGPDVGRSWGRYLVEGEDAALCQSVVDLLGDVTPGNGNPAARVLGSAAQAPPDVVLPILGRHPEAGEALRMALARDVHALLFRLAGIPLDADVEDVHRARVAIRRIRGVLRTFAPLFQAEAIAPLSDELAWLASKLGPVRDADVMLARVRETAPMLEPGDLSAAEAVMDLLRAQRQARWHEAMDALRSSRCVTLLDSLVASAADPPLAAQARAPAAATLARHTRRHWRRLRRRAKGMAAAPTEQELHRFRIAAKRVRYACETAALAVGKPAMCLAEAVGALQDVLGAHQDAVVLRNWLRGVAREHPGLGLAAAELAGIETARMHQTAVGWRAAWDGLDRKRLRRWMRG